MITIKAHYSGGYSLVKSEIVGDEKKHVGMSFDSSCPALEAIDKVNRLFEERFPSSAE